MDPGTEAELITRCCDGESLAWDELFDAHYQAAFRFVFQLAPDMSREDIEEICQETFVSVVRKLRSFSGNSRLQTWIFRIAANKTYDFREKRSASKRGGDATLLSLQQMRESGNPSVDPPSEQDGPDASLLQAERARLLRQALEQLGNPCREIIELRYFGELSYDEISKLLNLNIKTVSSRLSKCLHRLETEADEVFARAFGEKTGPFSVQ